MFQNSIPLLIYESFASSVVSVGPFSPTYRPRDIMNLLFLKLLSASSLRRLPCGILCARSIF